MIKYVYIQRYHYLAEGPALCIGFDRPVGCMTEDEIGRQVDRFRFIDWVDNCRRVAARIEAAQQLELSLEAKRLALHKANSDLEERHDKLEFAARDEDEEREFQELDNRLQEFLAKLLRFEAAETDARAELEAAEADFAHWGANLSDKWK